MYEWLRFRRAGLDWRVQCRHKAWIKQLKNRPFCITKGNMNLEPLLEHQEGLEAMRTGFP